METGMEKRRAWKIAKVSFGSLFLLLVAAWFWLLYRMAQVRANMQNLESGLFLARGLVLMAAGACFVMAVWFFISVIIDIKSHTVRIVLAAAAIACGLACLAFCRFAWVGVVSEYAKWPDGALF